MLKTIGFALFSVLSFFSFASQYYVTTYGLPTGDGSLANPWDLQTALNHPATVLPNDTIWLRDGVYTGHFTSNLTGSTDAYIYILQYPSERATIQDNRQFASGATLQINGSWCIYKNFEITNAHTNRNSTGSDSFRPMGIQLEAPHTKLINLIIHDVGHGVGFWSAAENAEIYGCLIYNCGTSNSPGIYSTHGHGIYSQNDIGYKTIEDNIIFNQFGFGLHLYPNPGNVKNYQLKGNTIFNNGILTNDTIRFNNILVNTYAPFEVENIEILNNMTYDSKLEYPFTDIYEADILLGATDKKSLNVNIEGNYFAGKGRAGLAILNWDTVTYSMNTSYYRDNGSIGLVLPDGTINEDYTWDYNTYFGGDNPLQFSYQYAPSVNFTAWTTTTNFDLSGIFNLLTPNENKIFIQPNKYESGRANIIIYNWENLNEITIDLTSIMLSEGQTFSIVDAQNYYGLPLATGNFSTANPNITISTVGLSTSAPVGLGSLAHTAPEFLTLVVIPENRINPISELNVPFNSLNCYPNPATNQIFVSFNSIENTTAVFELYSIDGILLFQSKRSVSTGKIVEQVPLQKLNSGFYLLKVINNKNTQTKMFYKE